MNMQSNGIKEKEIQLKYDNAENKLMTNNISKNYEDCNFVEVAKSLFDQLKSANKIETVDQTSSNKNTDTFIMAHDKTSMN